MQRISFDILCQRRIHVTVDAKKKKVKEYYTKRYLV